MRSLIIVFGALLLIIATPFVFQAIDSGITDEYSQSFSGVATGAGEYTGNITLSRAIYNDDTTSIDSISSNETSDTPTAGTYNTVTYELEVTGLVESTTRTLTVEFLIDSTSIPAGVATFLGLFRWFWIFIVLGTAGGAIYAFFD